MRFLLITIRFFLRGRMICFASFKQGQNHIIKVLGMYLETWSLFLEDASLPHPQ